MKKIIIAISALLLLSCSIGKNGLREIQTYHELTREQRLVLGKVLKEKFQVKRGTKIKHGFYERFSINTMLVEKGIYDNGEKVGIWKIWNEEDYIWIEKDFDNEGREIAIIAQDYLRYPLELIEKRDSVPTGQILIEIDFDEECRLEKSEILKGIDEEFDKKILNSYHRYVLLCNKYGNPIEDCIQSRDTLKINFIE